MKKNNLNYALIESKGLKYLSNLLHRKNLNEIKNMYDINESDLLILISINHTILQKDLL